ncbi:unnamed protein product [Heligmosomoides polygyrus]|uniref:Sulfate_transp domain-containing protein n=1 Tax=Heligmosomoides polygyrus TaxID=6339 RepID=A0A3P8D3K6_HELPZ|nr:unnamed protein product [Heligmosomoides polygyrus]
MYGINGATASCETALIAGKLYDVRIRPSTIRSKIFMLCECKRIGRGFRSCNVHDKSPSKRANCRIPRPELPTISILRECLLQSIGIAIVIIAVHISMAKMLGKKFKYSVDDNQELYAIGFTSMLGGCFPAYPVSTALGRTMVNVKSGTKTQLSTVFSCALLMSIILWLGPLLKDLPKCILASIITVALKSMFSKCGELRRIYPVSKIDFAIWVVSFVCTACIDVMEGLAISILFALFTVICRSQWQGRWLWPDRTYQPDRPLTRLLQAQITVLLPLYRRETRARRRQPRRMRLPLRRSATLHKCGKVRHL